MLDRDSVQTKLETFEKALSTLDESLSMEYSELVRDSSILRFQYCFELAWKLMKIRLEYEDGPVENSTPRNVIARAIAAGMIGFEPVWYEMLKSRNVTVHTYDIDIANSIFEKLDDFRAAFHELGSDTAKSLKHGL